MHMHHSFLRDDTEGAGDLWQGILLPYIFMNVEIFSTS